MLKKMSIKKIMVATSAILILVIMYILPDSSIKEIELDKSSIEYVYDNIVSTIYLVDSEDYVARTSISSCNCTGVDKAKDLVDGLVIDGKKSNIIPNGFRSIIPPGTSILDLNLEDKTLTINFTKELLDVNEKDENKMIESIIYTLTSIDGIDNVIIKVEGEILNNLPSGTKLPALLNRNFGINKSYDLVSTKDIDYYTMYYVNNYNDYEYYVPVTKYLNTTDDKIKVIIDSLTTSYIYEKNLMSFLNTNLKLNDYNEEEKVFFLDFNSNLYDKNNKVLEEVIYSISYSVFDNYDVNSIVFSVDGKDIRTVFQDELK